MRLRLVLTILSFFAICGSSVAHAAVRWISATGTAAFGCTYTNPCATLDQALSAAQEKDATVACIGTVMAQEVTLIRSVDINCSGGQLIFYPTTSATAAIFIDLDTSDTLQTVRIRGVSIFGASAGQKLTNSGIRIQKAAVVSIENSVISDTLGQGIYDARSISQSKLFVTDTIVRNNGGPGIVAAAASGGFATLDNVRLENNSYGLAVAAGNKVTINRSVMSGNSVAGVIGDVGSAVIVNGSTITSNSIGVQSALSVRLSNNEISFNGTAIYGTAGTFGNNRFSGNTSDGAALTSVSSAQK